MSRAISSLPLSISLVEYLRGRGMSLREIGEMIGLSESFISRVASGQRSFTLRHLDRFEEALGQPLPALVLEAQWKDKIPKHKKAEFEEVLEILRGLGNLRQSLRSESDERSEPRKRRAAV